MLKIENYVQCFGCLFYPLPLIVIPFKCLTVADPPHPPPKTKQNYLFQKN